MDELIERLRERAADPQRRNDAPTSVFVRQARARDLAGSVEALRAAEGLLGAAVRGVRQGGVSPGIRAASERIGASLAPDAGPLAAPVGPEDLARAETQLGVNLPAVLRRLYAEVADGGFGPGTGLLPLASVVARHAELCAGGELPRGRRWPHDLVPLVDGEPGCVCVDAATGRVVEWNPEGLSERSGERAFERSFRDVARGVEEWLGDWLDAPAPGDRLAEQVRAANIRAARAARASLAAKPEQRAAMGLPEVGWERIVWGGLGLEDDDER